MWVIFRHRLYRLSSLSSSMAPRRGGKRCRAYFVLLKKSGVAIRVEGSLLSFGDDECECCETRKNWGVSRAAGHRG